MSEIKMKAALMTGSGPLSIEEVTLNGPEAGEVLMKVTACGVCHSDLHMINMYKQMGAELPVPIIFGHEAAGIVEEVGDGVTSVKPGDHVVMAFHPSCGKCYFCVRNQPQICEREDNPERLPEGPRPRMHWNGKKVRAGIAVGGFAEYSCMMEGGVIKVRDDAPLDTVCLVGCAVTTGIGAATNTAKVEAGSLVAVIGIGGVGLNVLQGARMAGAHKIIAIDMVASKEKLAKQFGATDFIDASKGDPVKAVKALTNNRLDYAFEAIGNTKTIDQAIRMVRNGGSAIVVGLIMGPVTIPGLSFINEKNLLGCIYGSASIQYDIPRIIDQYMNKQILLDELVSKRRPLSEINEAFADMEKGEVARSVLDPSL